MKKIFAAIFALLIFCPLINAQDYSAIWKRNKYIKVGYVFGETKSEGAALEKGKFGVNVGYGNTFLFPKRPLWNMVKFGFDVNWAEFQYVKYHDYKSSNGGNLMPGPDNELGKLGSLGRMSLQFGLLGIGPNATIAPFSNQSNAARFLKASVYFHYQPTLGGYMMSQDGNFEVSYAYCNMFQFGGKISWKAIGIGVEGYWGSGKFKPVDVSSFVDDDLNDNLGISGPSKVKRKFASTRLYISINL